MSRLRKNQLLSQVRASAIPTRLDSPTVGLLTCVVLPSLAAISIALMQAATSIARARLDSAPRITLVLLSDIQVSDTDSGSQITIAADDALGEISTRMIGAWFELRIHNADARRVLRNFSGRGFEQGHVIQSGSDAVFLLRLQRAAKAHAVTEANSVKVIVSLEAASFANSSTTDPSSKSLNYQKRSLLSLRSGSKATETNSASEPAGSLEVPADVPPASSKTPASTETTPTIPVAKFVSAELPKVVIGDDPPPSKVVTINSPLRSWRPSISLPGSALTPIVIDVNLFTTATVPVSDEAPPPPPPKEAISSKAPVLKPAPKSDRALEEANKPVAKTESKSEAPATAPVETADSQPEAVAPAAVEKTESELEVSTTEPVDPVSVTDTDPKVVDPTKPSPAQINLPNVRLPQPRSRTPLSQEKRFELSGVISFDYSKTNQTSTPESVSFGAPIENRGHNVGVGLDLHFGTFVIDPRFLKLSFDSGFTTNRGGFDEFSTRQGNKGAGLYIDFLPTSPYPFRFHYTRQNTNFIETQISSAGTGRSSLGFDWSLRKPHWPNLSVNFEDTSYASTFVASSSFKSESRTLTISLTDNLKGWDVNSNFSKQSATEGITNLKTDLNFLRFDARRQLSKKANLFVTSFFEKLHFDNPRTSSAQDFSFFDIHSDFSFQQTKKLSFRASHQFYYSSSDQTAIISEPGAHEQPTPTTNPLPPKSVTSFNSAQGQVNYRMFPSLNFSGSASARFISTPESTTETAARFLDFTATISWNKRLGFAETRASFVEGITHARSSLGESRGVEFRSYSAGISMGRVSRALVTADFSSTTRPDAFQIGGSFSQNYFNVAVETHAVSRFRIRASIGKNLLDYATASGREHLKTATYSLSVDDKWFTVLLNHNSSSGVRDVFLTPITLDNTRIFRVLPIDSLVRDPLLNGAAVFTLGLVRFKPRNGLDLEVRYLRDKVLFARTNNVFTEQFDVLARYKLGKITLTSGFIVFQQDTENLFRRDRNYFFFRLSRPFTLF